MNPTEEAKKPHIFHFCPSPGTLGGIWTYIRLLSESALTDKYRISKFSLDEHTHGIEPKVIRKLAKKFVEEKIDILQVHDLMLTSWHAVVAAQKAKVPRILICCHSYSEDLFLQSRLKKLIWREFVEPDILKRADAVYNVSSFGAAKPIIQNSGIQNFGAISNAMEIVPAVAPSAELRASFGFKSTDTVALTVTRADYEKGWGLLADVAERMAKEGIDQPKLLLAGDGPHLAEISARLKPLVDEGRVVLPGRRNDVAELNAMANFFVSPTYRDYQAFAFLEAMQQHRAVLTTRVGGNSEIVVDGVTGKLIPPGDAKALHQAMQWFVANPDRVREMGEAGRRRLEEEFSMSRLVGQLDEVYGTLLSQSPAR